MKLENLAKHDHHNRSYPLPKSEFMYARSGPWPQPAPDHPMMLAAEVLHVPRAEKWDWTLHSGLNYMLTMLLKIPLAAKNAFLHGWVTEMGDDLFSELLTTTIYSKYLHPARKDHDRYFATYREDADLFVMDFVPIQDVQPYEGMFVSPTVTLFERLGPRGPYRPLAISVGNLVDGKWEHVELKPTDGDGWSLAKYFVLQGAGHVTTLSGHPATHFPYDTVNAVTKTSLPKKHTLFKLLFPHLRLALAVDNAVLEGGHSVVSETHGEIYAPYVAAGAEVRQLVAAGYIGYPHALSKYAKDEPQDPNYPTWKYPLEPRDIPSDFGLFLNKYHVTVKNFVRKVVNTIVSRHGTAQGDEEIYYIRWWAHYIAQMLPGFPDAEAILHRRDANGDLLLVSAVTTYIWDVAIAHSLEHKSYYGLGPRHTPFRIRVPPPTSSQVPGYDRKKVLDGWDLFRSTLAFEMFFKPHNVQLIQNVDYGFVEPELQQAQREFLAGLRDTEQELINEGVDLTKYALLSELATSIQY